MPRYLATALECAAVLAAVIVGGRFGVILLLVAGSIVLALRRGRWFAGRDADAAAGWSALAGIVMGAAALGGAWLISPAVLDATGRTVEWTTEPVVRGSAGIAATVMGVTLVLGLACEMVFRRWLLDRVAAHVVSRGEPRTVALAAGVLIAAAIEAAVSPGDGGSRVGIFVASLGLGAVYVTSGGRLAGCVATRATFELGAILLQALRLTA